MKNAEIKTNIEIDGVIINDKILKALRALQEDDNAAVFVEASVISDAICFISGQFDNLMDSQVREAAEILCQLSNVRQLIIKFKKP